MPLLLPLPCPRCLRRSRRSCISAGSTAYWFPVRVCFQKETEKNYSPGSSEKKQTHMVSVKSAPVPLLRTRLTYCLPAGYASFDGRRCIRRRNDDHDLRHFDVPCQ